MSKYNAKWNEILEPYIRYVVEKYKRPKMRDAFIPLIQELNEGRIRSRLIYQGDEVVAYSYVEERDELTDRLFGTIGFVGTSYCTPERTEILLNWMLQEAQQDGRFVILYSVYNSSDDTEGIIENRGFRKVVRSMMELDLQSHVALEKQLPEGVLSLPMNDVNPREFSDAQYDAYSGTVDSFLLSSKGASERTVIAEKELSGRYGRIITDASRLARKDGRIVGSILISDAETGGKLNTDCLVVDVFVSREFRRRGIGTALFRESIQILKEKGYDNMTLFVSSDNRAKSVYREIGFINSNLPEDIFYHNLKD